MTGQSYCNILRDDGRSYADYLEQLTYLLFLKMADEQHEYGLGRIVPDGYDWPSLIGSRARPWKLTTSPFSTGSTRATTSLASFFARHRTASKTLPSLND
jgi:hypothetical protein